MKSARKNRNKFFETAFSNPVRIKGIEISNGKIRIIGHENDILPEKSYSGTCYERLKGPKILQKFPVSNELDFNFVNALRKFDLIYAIDTNTKSFISVASLIKCELNPDEKGVHCSIEPITSFTFKYEVAPENRSWIIAIKEIINKDGGLAKRIGLVTDCNLGNIEKYNNKEIPLYENYFLPDNIKLIYASADSGSENLFNILLKDADDLATAILNELLKNSNF